MTIEPATLFVTAVVGMFYPRIAFAILVAHFAIQYLGGFPR